MSLSNPSTTTKPAPRSRQGTLRVVIGALLALASTVLLTLWAHVLICCGMHPEAIYCVDTAAPLLGLFCGAAWAGKGSRSGWRRGAVVATILVLLWFTAWSYLVSRFEAALWWRQAICGLTSRHAAAWIMALAVGMAGGALGARLGGTKHNSRKRNAGLVALVLTMPVLLLPALMQFSLITRPDDGDGREVRLSPGVTLRSEPPQPDGTQVRLLAFNLEREPQLGFGVYDADSDDAFPFDNRNTTWLGQGLNFVLDKIQGRLQERGREVRCLINGGFFGARGPWIGYHEAPLVVNSQALYNVHALRENWPRQAWLFGISRAKVKGARPQFHLQEIAPWNRLRQFETAIGGVRPLRVAGRSLSLEPGMGNTLLRCSRTSVGWSADSRHFYVLIVRDPDGEMASLQQRNEGAIQSGGWSVRQVQQFWERQGVPQAALFDGGESTQLAYRDSLHRYSTVSSAYQLKRTLGYWNHRPLRFYLPMLPATQNTGGVLNYLYIDG
jgi:Phosphodiester glycosidase